MKSKKIDWKLVVLICVHLLLIVGLFMFVKREYHSDEVLSFGIANDSVAPNLYVDKKGYVINYGEWLSGEVAFNRITVQEEERFHFEIPYNNALYDMHPPFGYMLIHAVSSLFPNQFSFWFFIPFNLFALIIIDVFIYRIMKLFKLSDNTALLTIVMYALCMGGISTMMFIRMYALLTAFSVMIVYYSLRVYQQRTIHWKDVIALIVVNALGGFTAYEYFVFAFFVALFVCVLCLFGKHIKLFFSYGFSMLAGVLLALAAFSHVFLATSDVLSGNGLVGGQKLPYFMQLKMILSVLLHDIFGFGPDPYRPFPLLRCLIIVLYIIVVLCPLYWLLRKEEKFLDFKSKIKRYMNEKSSEFCKEIKMSSVLIGLCAFVCVCFVALMNGVISIIAMGEFVLRYFYLIYPFLCIIFTVFVVMVVKTFIKSNLLKHFIGALIVFVCCCLTYVTSTTGFLGPENLEGENIQQVRNAYILFVLDNNSRIERLCHIIDPSNHFYMLNYIDIEQVRDNVYEVPEDVPVYMVVTGSLYEKEEAQKKAAEQLETEEQQDMETQIAKEITEEMAIEMDGPTYMEKLQDFLKDASICDHVEQIGVERTLNSTFYYYRLR